MTTVRSAVVEDGQVLREIERDSMTTAASPAPAPAGVPDFFRGSTRPEDVLVAEVHAVVVGYVTLEQSWPAPSRRHVIDIAGLGVRPVYRGRSLGRLLVDAAVQEAGRRGARKVALRVLAPNVPARQVYEACGFVIEGVLKDEFLLDGAYVDDVLMARQLDP